MYTADCTLQAANARVCLGQVEYLNLIPETGLFFRSCAPGVPTLTRVSSSDATSAPFYWTLIHGRTYALDTDLAQWRYVRLRL